MERGVLRWPGTKEKRRHLYLVLDDWSSGCSIHRIDLLSGDPDQQLVPASAGAAQEDPISDGSHRLPPPFLRLEAGCSQPLYIAGAFESKILFMQPKISNYGDAIVVYDVPKRNLMSGPRQLPDPVKPTYIMVGGRLFALADSSFERLYPPPCNAEESENFVWAWHKLPELPFCYEDVTCYAVVPDDRTLFVSTGGCGAPATLSFDTAESVIRDGECRWKQHGQWQLPFTGRAYYELRLDAWVGLSKDPRAIGHLCSCDAVPTDSKDDTSQPQCLAMKISKEKLFSEVPEERQIGATLVRMGQGKFCLLESVCIQADGQSGSEGEKNENSADGVTDKKDHRKRFIRLMTFSASYDKNGDLTTVNNRQLRYYRVPEEVTETMLEHPVAYWM